jgi:FkbM family methyltransferase
MDQNQRKLFEVLKVLKNNPAFSNIHTIVEIGARDCGETIHFNQAYPDAKIYSFECNPDTLPLCKQKIMGVKKITLIEKAIINTEDSSITFFNIDKEKTQSDWGDKNPGASSLLKASGKYTVENYVQKEVTVAATTLQKFCNEYKIDNIDLLWMDIQGAELMALQSAKDHIASIKLMHLEVEFFEIYKSQPLFNDLKSFLELNGFHFLGFTYVSVYSADAVFINKNIALSYAEQQYIEATLVKRTFRLKLATVAKKLKSIFNK